MQTAHNTNCTTPQSYMSCLAPAAHHSAPSTAAPQPYFIRASCSMNICQKVPFFFNLFEGPFTMLYVTSLRSSNMVKCQYCNVITAHQWQFCSYILPCLWTCHPEDRKVCSVQNIEGIIYRTPLFAMLLVKPLWTHLIKYNWMHENGLLLGTNGKITESLWKWAASQGLYFVWGKGER